jgi:hypothetical protein
MLYSNGGLRRRILFTLMKPLDNLFPSVYSPQIQIKALMSPESETVNSFLDTDLRNLLGGIVWVHTFLFPFLLPLSKSHCKNWTQTILQRKSVKSVINFDCNLWVMIK